MPKVRTILSLKITNFEAIRKLRHSIGTWEETCTLNQLSRVTAASAYYYISQLPAKSSLVSPQALSYVENMHQLHHENLINEIPWYLVNHENLVNEIPRYLVPRRSPWKRGPEYEAKLWVASYLGPLFRREGLGTRLPGFHGKIVVCACSGYQALLYIRECLGMRLS